jgi:hypothetical protein
MTMAVGDLPDSDSEHDVEAIDLPADSAANAALQEIDDQLAALDVEVPANDAEFAAAQRASAPPPPPPIDPTRQQRRSVEPLLPDVPAQPSPSTITVPTRVTNAPPTRGLHFRSDDERNRSVYRRANPWYRQLARGIVALTLLGGLGAAVFFGVQATQDWFDRARLPAPGAETATFRTTSFQIRSNAPAPELEGTLTIDAQTRAFEFVGGPVGVQAGRRIVSADGGAAYSQAPSGRWSLLADADPLNRDIRRAVAYLSDDRSADAILTNRLRRGYIDLVAEVDEGDGAGALVRYDMRLNTRAFAMDFPLQWQDFQATAIPGVGESSALAVSIRLDTENVLVAVTDDQTGWRWQRLDYFDRGASIVNPAQSLLDATTVPATEGAPDASSDAGAPATSVPTDG